MVDQISKKEGEIDASFPNLIVFIDTITFEVCGVAHNDYLNIVDDPLTFILKVSVLDLTYIKRPTYLEILEIGVSIFLNIAMFVDKLTDLIPEDKLVITRFLWN